MKAKVLKELPFYWLAAAQLIHEYQTDKSSIIANNSALTEAQYNSSFEELHEDIELAVFHLKVRSLNPHHRHFASFCS
jgi:hypothetical protein